MTNNETVPIRDAVAFVSSSLSEIRVLPRAVN